VSAGVNLRRRSEGKPCAEQHDSLRTRQTRT